MDQPPQRKALAYGGVVIHDLGQVLLREPTDHYGGYVWTFPKGRPDAGESAEAATVREVLEETGWRAEIVAALPGWFEGDVTATKFFVMRPLEDTGRLDAETVRVRWASLDDAKKLIAMTTSRKGRERDLGVLTKAWECWALAARDKR